MKNVQKEHPEQIVIVGAGLVGSLLSIYLARRGHQVDVFERNDDPRRVDISARRSSINLSLSDRGLGALERVGVADAVRAYTVPTTGRLIHDRHGGLTYQSYGENGEATYSIMRNDLNEVLLDAAEKQFGVRCHFNEKCRDLDLANNTLTFENSKREEVREIKASRIFGADGAFSAVRQRLQRTKRFNFSQEYLAHGYKEVTVPPSAAGAWTERRDAVHLWPRGNYMLLGLPNPDGSFVCSLHLPLEGNPSFESLESEENLVAFFEDAFPDAISEIPGLAEEFLSNSVNHFVSVRCYPWCFQDRVALIGDSAHAVFPFFAQGTNAGFEDCMVLDECLDEFGGAWDRVLEEYQKRRKPNADAISDMSREHYYVIRDQVGNPRFELIRKVEEKLRDLDAERFQSLYTLVTFTQVPYSEALSRGKELESFIDNLLAVRNFEERFENDFEALVEQTAFAA